MRRVPCMRSSFIMYFIIKTADGYYAFMGNSNVQSAEFIICKE